MSSGGISPEFAYTVGTGRLFMSMSQFHADAEQLLGRPIFTHEFASEKTWDEMRQRLSTHFTDLAEVSGA